MVFVGIVVWTQVTGCGVWRKCSFTRPWTVQPSYFPSNHQFYCAADRWMHNQTDFKWVVWRWIWTVYWSDSNWSHQVQGLVWIWHWCSNGTLKQSNYPNACPTIARNNIPYVGRGASLRESEVEVKPDRLHLAWSYGKLGVNHRWYFRTICLSVLILIGGWLGSTYQVDKERQGQRERDSWDDDKDWWWGICYERGTFWWCDHTDKLWRPVIVIWTSQTSRDYLCLH